MEKLDSKLAAKYELLEQIGSGGMSVVYKARNLQLDNICCVKVLREQIFGGQNSLRRLQREAKMLAALDHPNILRIITMDSEGDQYFLVTEFIDGQNLSELIGKSPMAPERVKEVFLQLAGALEYAHGKGIVHRDLKPSNVMVVKEGESETAKILDFGIAKILQADTFQKLTQTGVIIGTAQYIAPEQCATGEVDARSDIYSLGCMLYESLTGRAPFSGESAMEVMLKHTTESPPVAPGLLGSVAAQAMAKNPAERFQSAAEFAAALEVGALVPPHAPPRKRLRRSHVHIAMMAAIAALCGLVLYATMNRTQLSPPDKDIKDMRSTDELYTFLSDLRDSVFVYGPEYAAAVEAFRARPDLTAVLTAEGWQFKGRTLQREFRQRSNDCFQEAIDIANRANELNEWAAYELAYNYWLDNDEEAAKGLLLTQLRFADAHHLRPTGKAILALGLAENLANHHSYSEAARYYERAFREHPAGSLKQAVALHNEAVAILKSKQTGARQTVASRISEWKTKHYNDAGVAVQDEIDFAQAEIKAREGGSVADLEHVAQVVGTENTERVDIAEAYQNGLKQAARIQLALAEIYAAGGKWKQAEEAAEQARRGFVRFDDRLNLDRLQQVLKDAGRAGA